MVVAALALKRTQPRPKLSTSRSAVLDRPDEDLETMENSACHCTTHYCGELAAAAIQAVLEQAVPEEGTRASAGLYRTPQVGSNNGVG